MKRTYLSYYWVIIFIISQSLYAQKADLLIFSYNRPLQLYALLESLHMYVHGLEKIAVIYRSSHERFQQGYDVVKQEFPYVQFISQGQDPAQDFKPLTIQALASMPNHFLIFAVDDMMVTDFIDIEKDIEVLEQTQAYGMYYRLGNHVTYCYSMKQEQGVPPQTHVKDDIYAWRFYEGKCDWNYPNTVDMTLYRTHEVIEALKGFSFNGPNWLEGHWAGRIGNVRSRLGLCHEHTKVVNIPLNRVQNEMHNAHISSYSVDELLEKFEQGYKIDIHDLYKMRNKSAHVEYTPRFVKRLRPIPQDGTKHIVVVSASYNNADWYKRNPDKGWPGQLDTIFVQNYDNYHVIYIDDCSPDNTGQLVEDYVKERGMEDRVTLIRNKTRYGAMENQYRAMHSCKDDHVVVILDGDDCFANTGTLDYLKNVYADGSVWLTYGQFIEWPSGSIGFCCDMPDFVVEHNLFREFPNIPSHLRTFYAGLFNQIKQEDLMYKGNFFVMDADIAAMFPMIEMARQGHFRFIHHILCIYNGANSINDHKISKELQRELDLVIRARPRYAPTNSPIRTNRTKIYEDSKPEIMIVSEFENQPVESIRP